MAVLNETRGKEETFNAVPPLVRKLQSRINSRLRTWERVTQADGVSMYLIVVIHRKQQTLPPRTANNSPKPHPSNQVQYIQ